jgi:hypothetical protein
MDLDNVKLMFTKMLKAEKLMQRQSAVARRKENVCYRDMNRQYDKVKAATHAYDNAALEFQRAVEDKRQVCI